MNDNYFEENESQDDYETPVLEKEDVPAFLEEIIEEINKDRICLQCSGCHGCR